MMRKYQVRFGGGQTKKEQQCHLVGWLPTFDNIDQEALLHKLHTSPLLSRAIKGWLKAGVMEGQIFSPAELRMHSKTAIQRYTKVKGTASPYDGNLLYWSQRLKSHPMMHEMKARLLQKQQGKCCWCELHFKDGDVMEVDHIDRDHDHDHLSNKMLIHRHCHDERHAKHIEAGKRLKLVAAGINIT